MAADPDLARAGIRLRQFGQQVLELLGGRKIHSAWAVPGGVRTPLSAEAKAWILDRLPEARATVRLALDLYKRLLDGPLQREQRVFGDFPSLFLGLVGEGGRWEHIDGTIRVRASDGTIVADGLSEDDYHTFVCDAIGTPWADAELADLRARSGRVATSSFAYHHARLVEIVACLEAIEELVNDPELMTGRVRSRASLNRNEAVGVSEAPRGTLFHHYRVDDDGLIQKVNLIIATGQNNLAMNRTVAQIAREYITEPVGADAEIPEPLLNRVEAGIRCFDPCLSCSTHAAGQMPLRLELRAADGSLLAERSRG
jgi:NAD-reducing hydrogenase large subunit